MTAPPIQDPFEREHLLLKETNVLAFAQRAFELPQGDLTRWVALDLAAGVPHEIGAVDERYPARKGEVAYSVRFYELGAALAIATEIGERDSEHRVVEVLGVRGDVRVRVNVSRARNATAVPTNGGTHDDARAAGNVRVWGGEHGEPERAVASIHRHLRLLGLEPQPADLLSEPRFDPPAADRLTCEVPVSDAVVLAALIELLQANPVEGARVRPPRRLSLLEDRAKRADGGLVAYRFETHRAGTGIVHLRRREVEAGTERPGLVRTWNVVGLRGGARLRIREVAGRSVAEVGGSREGVASLTAFLRSRLGARA